MHNVKVSFIVPVYNSEDYVEQCINSIQAQTVYDWELLLINDGSVDKSEEICRKYEAEDQRIHYVYKENGGVSSARNLGLSKACGEYVCFVDSDDYIDSNYIELMNAGMEENTCMVAYGLKKFGVGKQAVVVSHRLPKGRYDINDIKALAIDDGTMSGFTFHSSCSILFKRKLIAENGLAFNENLKYSEDGMFVAEYLLNCEQGNIYVDFGTALYFYRENEKSVSHTVDMEKYQNSMERIEQGLRQYSSIEGIEEQIEKRRATIALDTVLSLKKPTVSELKAILLKPEVKRAFKMIKTGKLSAKKKVFYTLIRFRMFSLLKTALSSRQHKLQKI